MSGRCVAVGQLSPGKQEVVTSGGERDYRGPGLVTTFWSGTRFKPCLF